ncbi:MAG: hypothetical protein M3Y81_24125 [Chloroflexota bacterium]|nr:hypothetical protein [Chloroflexota bacterium]
MIQLTRDSYIFRLGDGPYRRNRLRGWLLFGAFLVCALAATLLSALLLPTYSHAFTLYLKWQDVLVALFWYIALLSLAGCAMAVRFQYALRAGYTRKMLTLVSDGTITVRDLSHKNLASIVSVITTALTCFAVALVGLMPEMLLGWTLSLPHAFLAFLATGIAVLLSIVGLVITIPVLFVMLLGGVSCVSFCCKMGSPHTYHLNNHASLIIDDFALAIHSPGVPESLVELALLTPQDQRQLLYLLRARWIAAECPWNPGLGEEIAAALEEAIIA